MLFLNKYFYVHIVLYYFPISAKILANSHIPIFLEQGRLETHRISLPLCDVVRPVRQTRVATTAADSQQGPAAAAAHSSATSACFGRPRNGARSCRNIANTHNV